MAELSEKSKENHVVIRGALAMSMGTMVSRVLGFIRDLALAALFSRTITDAFVVAFRMPNLFRRLLGEGSLSVSFIPIYVETREKQGPAQADLLASFIWKVLLLFASTLSVLGIVFMEPIIKIVVSGGGYLSISGKLETTVLMARVMFSYLFLVTNYGFLMAICQSSRKFFVSALAPALFNLTLIIFMFLPSTWFGFTGANLSWGVLVGGLMQLLVVVAQLYALKLLPKLRWRGWSPGATKVFINMIPGVIGLGVLQIMALINVNFASRLSEGSHSFIYFADRILELPQSLIAISMGAALLPALSSLCAKGQQKEATSELFRHIKLILFLSVPSAVGMYALGLPIVETLFKRGAFSYEDAVVTAQVVQIYSLLLVVSSFIKVFVTGFYAKKNTWYPASVAVLTLLIHVVLAHNLTNIYGLKGLVSATVVSASFNLCLLLVGFYFLVDKFSWLKVLFLPLQFVPASLVMGIFSYACYGFIIETFDPTPIFKAGGLMLTIIVSMLVYFGLSRVFRIKEVGLLAGVFKK